MWAELPSASPRTSPLSFGPLSLDPNYLREHLCKGSWDSQREVSCHHLPPPPQPLPLWHLRHDAKDGVVAADAGPDLLVIFLCVTHLVKFGLPKQTTRIRWLGQDDSYSTVTSRYSQWTPTWILQTRQRTAACGA